MLITTTHGIEGRSVTQYLGVVTAQGVLGVNAFKDVGAGMGNIFGRRSKSHENELASGGQRLRHGREAGLTGSRGRRWS
jgi:uncharacterized protein YbjQ (UPF0145 family)